MIGGNKGGWMVSDFFAAVSSGQSTDRHIAYHEKVGEEIFSTSLAVCVVDWCSIGDGGTDFYKNTCGCTASFGKKYRKYIIIHTNRDDHNECTYIT